MLIRGDLLMPNAMLVNGETLEMGDKGLFQFNSNIVDADIEIAVTCAGNL